MQGSYDPFAAINAAHAALDARKDELEKRIEAEAKFAAKVAEAFASHLEIGHSPVDFRTRDYDLDLARPEGHGQILSENVGALAVYRVWNELRDPPNPESPLPYKQRERWLVCEYVREKVGTPVPYAELANLGWSSGKTSSDNVGGFLLAWEADGKYVVRRTKLDGKVAFLIRKRRDDDPPADSYRSTIPEEPS